MENFQIGKREHNKATTKIQIMETFIKAMEDYPLESLKVEDLCQKIGISKVTFFNYFTSKEQIIEYFIAQWRYDISYGISNGTLKGIDGIKHIYHSVADHKAGSNIMITIMQYYLKHPNSEPIIITPYEYYLFNSKAYETGVECLNLPDIMNCLLNDLSLPQDKIMPTVLNLISGFFGVSFVMHIAGDFADKDTARIQSKKAFDRFVDAIL
ncbi:hypothetical protein SOV_07770 [Sporomusa ovata DSM 2662]|uniref:HTH tetR-type domain-containing protein n=1 Tax=Sporomusa ovata TaxID=2378 RepID=A0A0U1L7B8_9FIRM|nr:TetR/AcrR family transcriptional regulator [Sporomusa ovata]EQB28431.1 transcriptional regulator [Sporomusa ovata DSM 2662]CQR74754.1 hypothetical protein SpAn4DRAFT_4111 [Sporomusa ovata]